MSRSGPAWIAGFISDRKKRSRPFEVRRSSLPRTLAFNVKTGAKKRPGAPTRTRQAVHRARLSRSSWGAAILPKKKNRNEIKTIENEHLFIKDNGILKKIKLDDILWLEAMGDYIKIHVPGKWYIVKTTLKAAEDKITSPRFMRVHRSYIVALDKIDAIEDGVLTIMNKAVPVGESYRPLLMQKLNLL